MPLLFGTSKLNDDCETGGIGEGWLLGDSGYTCSPWLLTPLSNPQTPGEHKYNRSQKKTSTSERRIGVWKMRFRCLLKSGGCLMFNPTRCYHIIMATAIFYKVYIENSAFLNDGIQSEEDRENGIGREDQYRNGYQVLAELIRTSLSQDRK
ncbi:putative nuclease HARBI1 [Macrobrachium rosenbergii]|uniref:putative nuclease HARBI1 n=1 Tax=Macrobrachium rosenbergii TaxID=79674 RepID=UPI0034D5A4AB